MEHMYAYIDSDGGVCKCGAFLSWYGRPSGPKSELSKHITESQTNLEPIRHLLKNIVALHKISTVDEEVMKYLNYNLDQLTKYMETE